jgi:hypothetical protein
MLKSFAAVSFAAKRSRIVRNGAATTFYAIFRKVSRIRNISIGNAVINGQRINPGRKYLARRSSGH